MLLSIALLLGFSSCGIKESNSFKKIDFNTARRVKIIYNETEFESIIRFNGSLLEMELLTDDEKDDSLAFSMDSMSCTTSFMGIKKSEQTAELSDSFTPKIIFLFLSQLGAEFTTELYNEDSGLWSVLRNVGNKKVCFEVSQNDTGEIYSIKIN